MEPRDHFVYIMISQTHTGFAMALRRVGGLHYNHASIALDDRLNHLYSFARPNYRTPMLARLNRESVSRYTLLRERFVDVVIFRLPVTQAQYEWARAAIRQVEQDEEYLYNLFSVLTHPLTGGFCTYKSFSCIEFVMYLLQGMGIKLDQPLYRYKPGDLLTLFPQHLHFQGNLLDYCPEGEDPDYFAPVSTHVVMLSSVRVLGQLLFRLVCRPHCYESLPDTLP